MDIFQVVEQMAFLARRGEGGGNGMGCFVALLVVGIVVYLILRGRRDREEQLGAAHRPMGSGPVEGFTFANPYPKCPACGAAGDKMKQQWDGMRKVTWSCGYCGATAGVQELRDEELPPSARQRLGLDQPQGMQPGMPGRCSTERMAGWSNSSAAATTPVALSGGMARQASAMSGNTTSRLALRGSSVTVR